MKTWLLIGAAGAAYMASQKSTTNAVANYRGFGAPKPVKESPSINPNPLATTTAQSTTTTTTNSTPATAPKGVGAGALLGALALAWFATRK